MSLDKIRVIDFNDNKLYIKIDKEPDRCPICNKNIHPRRFNALLNGKKKHSDILQIIYRCPNNDCQRVFLALYKGVAKKNLNYSNYELFKLEPKYIKKPKISNNIKDISKNFVHTYKEAIVAEKKGLTEIAGMGYRKALEILIKDYIINVIKEDFDTIKDVSLGSCIKNYIDDASTKKIAQRTAWLGNDHAHYYKKWKNKELEDLKTLLELSINAIDNKIKEKKYIEEMPKDN